MVQESEVSCSGFQRARRLFGVPDLAIGDVGSWQLPVAVAKGFGGWMLLWRAMGGRFVFPTVSPHERGMERGRLLSPLPKMARYDRAHLVSLTNDLWVLFYGDNIREFLTLAPHPALSKRSL